MKPKRIQRKRTKGWRMPPNTVYVGRPTKWGNQWVAGRWSSTLQRIMSSADAIERFRTEYSSGGCCEWQVKFIQKELRGKDLACWCSLDKPCHADVLLELANR